MTPEDRTNRSSLGGSTRWLGMTPEQRREATEAMRQARRDKAVVRRGAERPRHRLTSEELAARAQEARDALAAQRESEKAA